MSVALKIGRTVLNRRLFVSCSSAPTVFSNQNVHRKFLSTDRQENNSSKTESGEKKSSNRETYFLIIATGLGGYAFYSYLSRRRTASGSSPSSSSPPAKGLGNVLHGAETFAPKFGEKSRRDRFNFISEVVEETAPALVYIQIKDLGVRDFYTGEAVTTSNGSGFIVKEDGLILTNAHVVLNKPRSSVQVTLHDGRTFVGVVEDADVGSDLATVRIQAKNLPTIRLGNSSTIRPGEFVIAMGSPLSLTNTITTGVVSSPARDKSELNIQGRNVSQYIQTDAAITFGNSGGPLLNLDGEAIGINSMKLTPGISFAIPIDHAKEFLQKTAENGKKRKPWKNRRYLGITMVALEPRVVQELRLRHQLPLNVNNGILVFRMVQDSPADRAGIRPGDIITHINGSAVTSSKDIYNFLDGDEKLRMTMIRAGKIIKINVNLDS